MSETEWSDERPSGTQILLGPLASVFLALFALLGLVASAELLWSEITLLGDSSADLMCDVNSLIGCSTSLLSWQAHLLTVPNSLIGAILFAMLLMLAILQVSKVPAPRWMWHCLQAGSLAGCLLVIWFLIQSVTGFRTLCPYCLLVWAATIAITVLVWTGRMQYSRKPALAEAGRILMKYVWVLVACVYLVVALVVAAALSGTI